MNGLRRALIAIGVAGLAAGAVAVVLVLSSDHQRDDRVLNLIIGPLIGWAFIGAGLVAWWRRPENRFGSLMTLLGFVWFAGALGTSDVPGVFIVGVILSPAVFAILIHLLLGFPTGRVHGRSARALTVIGYVDVLVVLPIGFLFVETKDDASDVGCDGCPANPLLVDQNETAVDIIYGIYAVVAFAVLVAVAVVLVRRWRAASAAQRRSLGPLYLTGGLTMVLTSLVLAADFASNTVSGIINVASVVFLGAVPFAFLASLLRNRLARAGAISGIVASEGGDMRGALASALGDPTLELGYWLPERGVHIDREGHLLELTEGSDRVVSPVEHDGARVATIAYDAALADEPELVSAVVDAAALALENERLDAELAARIEELQTSRARVVEIGLEERRRLERDLHDGAQQRLVALRLQLALARESVAGDPEDARELIAEAMGELDSALEELRELARGIHPAVLADRGLEPALSALARRAPLPVEVTGAPTERLPAPVEVAAYFVVAEALTNVAKYAQATHASVAVERLNGHAVVEVRDDGIGGADISRGTGLAGLADRLSAVDGRLQVESPTGGGTVVRADIPCA